MKNTRFSPKLFDALTAAGWYQNRSTMEELRRLNFISHPMAYRFFEEFGGLNKIGKDFVIDAYDLNLYFPHRDRFSVAQRVALIPIGESYRWCDSSVWMDIHGAVYIADDQWLAFVADHADAALEILAFRLPLPDGPRWEIDAEPLNYPKPQ